MIKHTVVVFDTIINLNHTLEEVSDEASLPEILWNFSRYMGPARITLEQNPHFYSRCPADESSYTPISRHHPLQDTRGALEHNNTLYVFVDGPYRVFLHTEHKSRIFCNIWLLNGLLIFRGRCPAFLSCRFLSELIPDSSGVLEGEDIVRASNMRYNLRYCEQPVGYQDSGLRSRLNHSHLPPIVTTPRLVDSSDEAFEDWTALSRPASHFMDMHIYGSRASPESIISLVCLHESKFCRNTSKHLYRTYLHLLQHPNATNTVCYTQL
jgi:hypothetical protein